MVALAPTAGRRWRCASTGAVAHLVGEVAASAELRLARQLIGQLDGVLAVWATTPIQTRFRRSSWIGDGPVGARTHLVDGHLGGGTPVLFGRLGSGGAIVVLQREEETLSIGSLRGG